MNSQMTAAQAAQQGNRNADGTYGFGTHSEAEVRLFDTHRGGTFFNPTPPSTAKACVEFWSNVDAPDDAIDRFSRALKVQQAQELNEALTAALESRRIVWATANPMPQRPKDIDAWNAEYAQVHRENLDELSNLSDEELLPGAAHKFDLQQLARVAQMVEFGPSARRFPEEHEALMETNIELYNGPVTVRDAWNRHGLGELQHHLEYRDSSLEVLAELRGVQAEVRAGAWQAEAIRADANGW